MTKASKIGIVVQRWHSSIAGGSEALAWQYASLLRGLYEVEILTSTAVDAVRWENELPPGVTEEDGVGVRRFLVKQIRSSYWHSLHERLQADVSKIAWNGWSPGLNHRRNWTLALQHEFILRQGPDCPELFRFIENHAASYDGLIFVTYLYPTTYFGRLAAGNHPNTILVPTLHAEPPARLSAYAYMARRFRFLFWNTEAERRLSTDIWGALGGAIVSMAVDCGLAKRDQTPPYLLYCGRIDRHKGCAEMFEYFLQLKSRHPSSLKLRLTGVQTMEIPGYPDIEFLGFVSEGEKKKLMRDALALVMPSAVESLSIVTLESLAQETPVLGNSASPVVASHLIESGGGMLFDGVESFARGATDLMDDPSLRNRLGNRGRDYVKTHYATDAVRARLVQALES